MNIQAIEIDKKTATEINGMIFTSTGEVRIGKVVEKQISISVDRYNELTKDCKWELLNAYIKNDCYTTKWKNKKTGEDIESIGTHPPSERLRINYTGDPIGIGYEKEQPPKKLKVNPCKKRQGKK